MLLYSTVLPIKDSLTKDAFIELAIRWNQGSRAENVIPEIEWDGNRNVRFGNEKLWMQIEEYRNQNIIAIRYEKVEDDGLVWDTDFVMNFNEMKMSIRLDRSFLEEAQIMYATFHTPAFIALLIDEGFVQDDNSLPVGRRPVLITENNLDLIADVINEKEKYNLPVVYISKTDDERDPVNAREVAKRLKGVAHVLVQKESWTTQSLRRVCDGQNEYNGAIGIYFPNQAAGHVKMLNHIYEGSGKVIADKVIQRVIRYSNSQRIDPLYTWQGVNNALLRDRYSSKREELAAAESARRLVEFAAKMKAQEADMRIQDADQKVAAMRKEAEEANALAEENKELVESVDEEMKQMRQEINDLTRQNDALSAENEGLRAQLNALNAVPLLFLGEEEEFFPGEIKEFVLQALEKELQSIKSGTRRADTLGDIIKSNGGLTGLSDKKKKDVKDNLFGYSGMTKPLRSFLKSIGFIITEEGKHHKLTYYGDGRYWTTVDKTPSDIRGGKNAALTIIRDML